jgi:hypothetical protein
LALGLPRGEMLRRMSSKELSEWMAFYQIEPFGGDADYIGSAIVAQTVANRHRNKDEKPHITSEFIPKFEPQEQSVGEQLQVAKMMTIALGGTVNLPDNEDEQ